MKKHVPLALFAITLLACNSSRNSQGSSTLNANQEIFWKELQALCGKTFDGSVAAAPANDTLFRNKTLKMEVRSCEQGVIRIPFSVGEDHSRTWVISRETAGLRLKHDHRHGDGTPDSITMYGGNTSNGGMATMQFFPADQETVNLLPAAAGNVWWIELVPRKYFTYNLRRMGSERVFSVRFELQNR